MTLKRPRLVLLVVFLLTPLASAMASPGEGPLTVDRVVAMCNSGVPDTMILAVIERDHPVFVLDTAQVVWLRRQRVSERIILAMLTSGPRRPACALVPVLAPQQPTSTRGIFFTQPTRGIFFAPPPAAACR